MKFAGIEFGEEELRFIAGLDYGKDVDKHYQELRKVLLDQHGLVTKEQVWFPYEVIELGANHMQPGQENLALCTCLVAHAIIRGVDLSTDVEYKFDSHAWE